MMTESAENHPLPDGQAHTQQERPRLSDAAKRALAEAEERRAKARAAEQPHEIGGRGGLDPARFGDWEIDGRAIDF